MQHHRRRDPISPFFQSGHATYNFRVTVKVENLSKATPQAALEQRLRGAGRVDVCLKACGPAHPANYAYVNCLDHSSAQQVIAELNNKLLDGNRLRAKMKESSTQSTPPKAEQRPSRAQSTGDTAGHGSGAEREQPVKDMAVVKLLIYRPYHFTTEKPLDQYFSRYGELATPITIKDGKPDYAYANFRSPVSAERCRAESPHTIQIVSPHTIQRVTVIAPPKKGGRNVATLNKVEFACDPLVASYVEDDARCHFQANRDEVKVLAEHNMISLYTYTEEKRDMVEYVRKSISEHQGKLTTINETLDCCYLPALADPSVQKRISEVQVPFELLVHSKDTLSCVAGSTYRTIQDLIVAYRGCDVKTALAANLQDYIFPIVDYQWYWEDDSAFKPYTPSLCKKLEEAFETKRTLQEPIRPDVNPDRVYVYNIDTAKMTQMNLATKKVRTIKRKALTKRYTFKLQIRGHSQHIKDIQREIMEKMDSIMTESTLSVLDSATDLSFINHLLQTAREAFVSADAASDGDITLKGVSDAVKQIKEVLSNQAAPGKLLKAEVIRGMDAPKYWEKQKSKCELKQVHEGGAEWSLVEQHMEKSGLKASIVRIERIQNLWQWEAYEHSHKRMSEKNGGAVNEKYLFHGSSKTPPKVIYNSEQGFDNRLASRGVWGEGSYFAVKASYSDKYAHRTESGHKQIFLVYALIGITCRCEPSPSMKVPPKKSEVTPSGTKKTALSPRASDRDHMFEEERYDSVCGVSNGSKIFVIYEHGKVYPGYLITYSTGK